MSSSNLKKSRRFSLQTPLTPYIVRTFNVVILGVGFLFIFTAFTTCGNVEVTEFVNFAFLITFHFYFVPEIVLGIIYGVFSFSNLLAPMLVTVIGPKITMFLSGLLYSGYIAMFIVPSTWSFYLTSVLIGIGAAMLWTAQGQFLVENSEASTINRNTGMFWALLQCRYGATPVFVNIFLSLLVISILGTLSFLLQHALPVLQALSYLFYSGVYGTCIGATAQFAEAAKGLIGISGIVVGIGENSGGLFGLLCKNSRFRRTSVVFLGMVAHFVAFYLIFLNIPDDAPVVFETTSLKNVSIALLCSFLLGLGDSCFNTQLYSILGHVYAEESTPAFAIFKFIQSVCAAAAFFYSGYIMLMWQLLLMVILGFTGTLCFFVVERMQNFSVDIQEF
uniref:UNC93-like protein MFSD11 n=1 Tax=Oreochromis niloticus TaxID=8128 RepID=A0A669EBQ7_ORENI